ncbi:Transcription factor RF2b [Carex littledalei]|uniref:Transcription factor RF2b n=1 Tax=Carex littledalei TaxID=544730 RepID=A0A833VSK6_9POAL|nr:Transcription factor RF2b [Carex littledalei]
MNNLYNENTHELSYSMDPGFQSNPSRFGTDVFCSPSVSEMGRLSFDTISPPCASPSDSTSLHNPISNQGPTSPALTHHQPQNDTPCSTDGMFSSYENFGRSDNLLNSSGTNIRGSLMQPKNSEPEVDSCVNKSRSSCVLTGGSMTTYNLRDLSNDNMTGKLNSDKALLLACNQTSRAKRVLNLELRDQEFTRDETNKIMANEKLAELALADPKRVKRILANRQSATRSKEKRMRYVMELEHKMHILQTENSNLSAKLTLLQRESMGLVNRNNELRIRLEALRQQSQLQNVLNEALKAEVQRLKLEARELIT